MITNLSNNLKTDIILLFDVDSGAEYIPECQEYLIEHADSVICLMASPDDIYAREIIQAAEVGNAPQSKEVFLERDFSPAMQKLYSSAAVTIEVVNQDTDNSVEAFKTAVYTLASK